MRDQNFPKTWTERSELLLRENFTRNVAPFYRFLEVTKCKTCPDKVNAKSKFGVYILIVETGACKVVCDSPLDLCVIYKRGRRGPDVAKEAVGEEADA